jgi:N-acetylmuramoyl-L-alanine amidase
MIEILINTNKTKIKYLLALSLLFSLWSANTFGITIKDIDFDVGDDATSLVLYVNSICKFTVETESSSRLVLHIPDGQVSKSVELEGTGKSLIHSYSFSKSGDELLITINLCDGATNYKGYVRKNPQAIVFTIFGKPKTDYTNVEPKVVDPDKTLEVDTIVIDPGHGGHFTGAVGPEGTMEKDVNLDISLILKRMLEDELGMKVYLTREKDDHVTLKGRTDLANEVKADLFISVHNNAYYKRSAHGTETFFLAESSTDYERTVALRENEDFIIEDPSLDMSKLDDLTMILAQLTQNEFLQESSELAELVQEAMVKKLKLTDRGVKQAPFYVLVGSYCPAILVEIAFISNYDEEQLLLDPNFQNKAARAIFEGIKEYKKRQEKRLGLD